MLNASTLQYETNQTGHQARHRAIVIGGSIAGLLAARVLLNHFEQVILIERDELQDQYANSSIVGQASRPGVPQVQHVHVLLVRGQRLLESLFPGITTELEAAGASVLDWFANWITFGSHGWRSQGSSDLQACACSRHFLETHIRQRLFSDPRCVLLQGCHVQELQYQPEFNTVTGVRVHRRKSADHTPDEWVSANLVVDASGRNSALPQWLEQLGYAMPQETIVNSFLGYSTGWFEPPAHLQRDWQGITIYAHPGENTRGGVLYEVEGNRWIVTLAGSERDYPPTDLAGFLEFARTLRNPIIYQLLQRAKPVSPIYSYRRTENRLLHYDRIALPDGIVVLGDAVCAFNPIYGQGMTTAALGASALDRCLATFGNRKGLTQRFQKQLAKVIKTPWLMATGEDSRWSATVGARSSLLAPLFQAYVDRVLLVGTTNEQASLLFLEVLHMVKPPTALLHPSVMLAVLKSFWQPLPNVEKDINQLYQIQSPEQC